jgi:thiamine-phosphate pyrophosphorylase
MRQPENDRCFRGRLLGSKAKDQGCHGQPTGAHVAMQDRDSTQSSEETGTWRAFDASANRAAEALRVIEDVLRFARGDGFLARRVKQIRHDLAAALDDLVLNGRVLARDVADDPGLGSVADNALPRTGPAAILAANIARAGQALRSLEECGAVVAAAAALRCQQLRYRLYEIERSVLASSRGGERLAGISLCVLVDGCDTAASFERLLTGLLMAGVRMVQVREKSLPLPVLCERVRMAVKLCRAVSGPRPLLIVNDRADVAAALAADGVHLGDDDLPVPLARRLLGIERIVGRTAHSLEEARAAVLAGVDYLGVGPCFPSPTKRFTTHASRDFLTGLRVETSLPAFAIGGITIDRLDELFAVGLRRIAVASAITAAADPPSAARAFLDRLEQAGPP